MSTRIVIQDESTPIVQIEYGDWSIARHRVPDLRQLPDEEAQQWQRRLTTLATDCGCTIGLLVAVATLGIYLTAATFRVGGVTGNIWVGVGVFILGSAAGKLLGMWRAEQKLDQALDILTNRIIDLKLAATKSK